ncbi:MULTISPECIES: STAS/SEC14 domain-containing protein [Flavobacterium]|uniref:STAS/SEC14 domain-containing protein n=1 Tax=Flavobacterium hankyongi TaxID=1176532 RepID=A0ABP8ZRN8_9FLAO|nr:STAS/SEC14 domain-containing protein [Flavobacterium sp. N1846]
MLQLLDFTGGNIIATRANDLLGIKDYEKIHPFIHNIMSTGKKVRWYFEMDDSSSSNSIGFWEDGEIEINYGNIKFTHSNDIELIAIVGDKKWKKCMISIMKPFTMANLRYFELSEKEKAKEWIINEVNADEL